jgi:YVTN family beta-propeller protein
VPVEDLLRDCGQPGRKKIYVTNLASNTVSIIDTTSNTVVSTVKTENPRRVAVSPDEKKIYVTNNGDKTVSIINTTTKAAVTTVSIGKSPKEIAVTPDGTRVYVANSIAKASL